MFWDSSSFKNSTNGCWGIRFFVHLPGAKKPQSLTVSNTGYFEYTKIINRDGSEIEFQPHFERSSFLSGLKWSKKYSNCVGAAIVFHILICIALVSSVAVRDEQRLQNHKIADLSKAQVSVVSDFGRFEGPNSSNQISQASRLLNQWSVRKSIRSADQVLKPQIFDQAFAKSSAGSSKLRSWNIENSIEDSKLQKPLNLTEQEIAEGLRRTNALLRECYNEVLIRDASLKGKPQIILDINEYGKIYTVNVVGLQAQNDSLAQLKTCFFKAYQTVVFRKPNQAFTVSQTMVLNF